MALINDALVNDDLGLPTVEDGLLLVEKLREAEYLMLEMSYPIESVAARDPGH